MAKKTAAKKTAKAKKVAKKTASAKKSTKKVAKKASKPVAKKKVTKKVAKKAAKAVTKKATKAVKKKAAKAVTKKATKAVKKKVANAPAKEPVEAPVQAKPTRKKIKSPLTKKELANFRTLLLEKRKSILGDMNGIQAGSLGRNLQDSAGDLSTMPTHPADIGSDNFEHEFSLGLLESERALLQEINEALERIEDGLYGVCLGTGEPIGKSRLKARPWCKYCIEYQKMIEKGLVRPGEDDQFGPAAED